jgi:hypothetical protein
MGKIKRRLAKFNNNGKRLTTADSRNSEFTGSYNHRHTTNCIRIAALFK